MDTAASLLLLLTQDSGKPARWGTRTGWALSAAAVADLLVAERLTLSHHKDPRVTVVDDSPTGSPALDRVLARIRQKDGKRLSALVQDRRLDPTQEVVDGLADAGIIGIEPERLLGLVPEKRPILDPRPEQEVRERLRTVLRGGRPEPTDATLLAILDGMRILRSILRDESADLTRTQLKARLEEATRQVAVGDAVRRALDAMNTAITAGTVAAVTTASS